MTDEINNLKLSILNRLAAEKKKVFVAALLISLMIFMWTKLLIGPKPQTAGAISQVQKMERAKNIANEKPEVFFKELPFEHGRHSVLIRDFFNINETDLSSNKQVNIVSSDPCKDIRFIAEKLRLQAIGMAPQPDAFINDKLVKINDVLVITDGSKEFECKIIEIDKTKVLVKCGKAEIELKLKQQE